MALVSVRIRDKEEAKAIAERLGLRGVSTLLRLLFERPEVYGPLVERERAKLRRERKNSCRQESKE